MGIFQKLYHGDSNQALDDILDIYYKQWYCVVNYLYFANIVSWGLFEPNIDTEYSRALMNGDFLLPDGIALQTYYKRKFWKNINSLNWTDFSDYVLTKLKDKKINLIIYWAQSGIVDKAVDYIKNKYWIIVSYFQEWYSELDFSKIINNGELNILMVWKWSPRQEIWVNSHMEEIKKHKLLVFNQWGTFDFRWGLEKRAPYFIRMLKAEWLWRVVTNPKKNIKKVYYSLFLFKLLLKKD